MYHVATLAQHLTLRDVLGKLRVVGGAARRDRPGEAARPPRRAASDRVAGALVDVEKVLIRLAGPSGDLGFRTCFGPWVAWSETLWRLPRGRERI
jgi:hypothetical protein